MPGKPDPVTKSSETPLAAPPRRKSRARHAKHAGHMLISSLLGLSVMAAITVYVLIGQTIRAPNWVRDRIEARAEQGLAGMELGFSEIEFVLREGWRPRVRLRDMTLTRPDGQRVVEVANAEVSLAMTPLLQGKIQPRRIYLSGGAATLRRDADGRIALFVGDGTSPFRSAANLPQLIEEYDQVLTIPQLSELTSIDMEALTLRFEDVGQGRAWTLDGGRITLDRDGDQLRVASSFALLGGGDKAGLVEANYSSRIGETGAQFGISVQDIPAPDIAAQGVALNWLGVLVAPISGSLRGGVDNNGALGPLSATLQIGAGAIQPNPKARPIPFSGARSYFTFSPGQQVIEFDELSVDTAWGSGMAEGRAYLGGIESGRLADLIGQFTFTNLSLNPNKLYEEPLKIGRTTADFRLELNPFRVTIGQLLIDDGESDMLVWGDLEAGPEGWKMAIDGHLDSLTPERLMTVWPARAAPKPRKWVEENLLAGTLRDLDVALRIAPGSKPDIYADFSYQDAQVRFLKTMPPITAAAGQATLVDDRFTVTATQGQILPDEGGPVDVAGTSFIIPDISIRHAAPGIVRVAGTGPVTSVMSLLNRPPLTVLKDTPLPVDLAQGTADVTGTLALPLKDRVQFGEIDFHVDGEVRDVTSTVLVPGHDLTAARLAVQGDQTYIELNGAGHIDKVPADVRWRQPLGEGVGKQSRVDGTIELSQTLIDTFDIGLPDGSVSGAGPAEFTLDLSPGEPPKLNVQSSLQGVGLSLPELGWSKPAAREGKLELEGIVGEDTRIDRLFVQGAGLSATGTVTTKPDGGLDQALFSSVRVGNWMDAKIEMVGRGEAAPLIRILGGTLDMRSADFGSDSSGGGTDALTVSLGRLQITDTIALTNFAANFRTTGGLQGEFSGRVNGQTPVTGHVAPSGNASAYRVLSDDAGGVFRSAGILTQGRGGSFNLTLVPTEQTGQYEGALKVRNTRVKDAPAIAALLNAVSVIGLIDEMSGQGIQFTEVDARFRLTPDRLYLTSSSAVGPSIGISMDGTYDVASSRLNMQGAISPVYLLNSVGSVLTRKGEGMFAFSYTLKGTSDDPAVAVNPVSALAPGMIRDIFRKPIVTPDGEPAKAVEPRPEPGRGDNAAEGR